MPVERREPQLLVALQKVEQEQLLLLALKLPLRERCELVLVQMHELKHALAHCDLDCAVSVDDER